MLNAAAATWISAAAVVAALMVPVGWAAPRGSHTPLVNKDIPCAAENLKVGKKRRYMVQGDTSGSGEPPLDIITKVLF